MSCDNPKEVIEEIYLNLTTGCLCSNYQQQHLRAMTDVRPNESSRHVLLQLSVFRLLSEVFKVSDEDLCVNVNKLAHDIVEGDVGRRLLILLETNDKFVGYAARKAFSGLASHVATDVDVLVENLCRKIVDTVEVSKVNIVMETLIDIIENGLSENVRMQQFSNTNCTRVKRAKGKVACKAVVQVLGEGFWTEVVTKLNNPDCSSSLNGTFLTLCYKIVLAVKRYFSEEFLENFIISNVIQIFRNEESLATPTLMTQADMLIEVFTEDNVNDSSGWRKQLANAWLVKTGRLSCNNGVWKMGVETVDVILLRKIILSVLKASAILGRESGAILCLKELTNDELIDIFVDQDDQLIHVMLAILNLHVRNPDYKPVPGLNPHLQFLKFLSTISFDHQVIVDFLISTETPFLLFFTKYLKLLTVDWKEFLNACRSSKKTQLETAMTALIQTRFSVERLHDKELFPYNAGPLLKLIKKCERLYEGEAESE